MQIADRGRLSIMDCGGKLAKTTNPCTALIHINPKHVFKDYCSLLCGCKFLTTEERKTSVISPADASVLNFPSFRLSKVCLKRVLQSDRAELKWRLKAAGCIWCPLSALIPFSLCKHVAFLINSFSSECDLTWFDLLSRAIAFHINAITA